MGTAYLDLLNVNKEYSTMIKRCYLVVIYGVLLLWASVISAQTVQEEGAAVKLGSGATIKNTIVWGNKGKQLEGGKSPVNCHIQGVNGAKWERTILCSPILPRWICGETNG